MPLWPSTLPQSPLIEGFSETAPSTTTRTEMDQGPAKVRQKTTAGVRRLILSFLLSKTQTATLDAFFHTDTKGGSLSFTFPHPRTNESLSCRFTQAPRYQTQNGEKFRAGVELEVMP